MLNLMQRVGFAGRLLTWSVERSIVRNESSAKSAPPTGTALHRPERAPCQLTAAVGILHGKLQRLQGASDHLPCASFSRRVQPSNETVDSRDQTAPPASNARLAVKVVV